MCDLDYVDDRWDASSEKVVRAKKEHRCDCCGGRIPPGRKYLRLGWVFERTAGSEKCCLPCHRVSMAFAQKHNFYTQPSGMQHLLEECIAEDDEDAGPWKRALREMKRRRERAA